MKSGTRQPEPKGLEKEATQAFKSIAQRSCTEDHDGDAEFDIDFDAVVNINDNNDRTGDQKASERNHAAHDRRQLSGERPENMRNASRSSVKTEGVPTSKQSSCEGQGTTNLTLSSDSDASVTERAQGVPDREPQKARKKHSRGSKTHVPPGIRKLPSPPTTLEQAQMEWDLVETVQPGSAPSAIRSPTVTFKEVVKHFQSAAYLEQHMSYIKPTIKRRGCAAIGDKLFGPPKMDSALHTERNLIFALALCMFLNEEPIHGTILQTIYKKLTGTKLDCPRYGNHWELIGFQGLDPATDLRGCGLLGLLNALFLVTNERTHTLALEMYKLSQHEAQNFPFCVMSINITRIALQTLREGKLNKYCNSRRQVIHTFCEFYAAIFFHIYQVWKHQHKTISDSGFVLKEAEKFARDKTNEAVNQLEKHLSDRKNLIIPDEENMSPKNRQVPVMDRFAGVCDLQVNEEEEVHLV